jgi:hypothetical protein
VDASIGTVATSRIKQAAAARTHEIPWFTLAALFGSTSILIGGIWDISWHRSIGRDTFWSPPHLAIYLGGIVAGLAAAWVVLKTTFAGDQSERDKSVRIWGFSGPLGAFFCIWGALAMLTSAPFDDWWHNTYGLDTKILSPPHVILGLGVIMIKVGTMLAVLALQNRLEHDAEPGTWPRLLYTYAAGLLLSTIYLMMLEFQGRGLMHTSILYKVGCAAYPILLVGVSRASRLRWSAVAAAAVYMAFFIALLWILPFFHAEPKLGPVRNPITHMMPLSFPLLLVVPALAIDLLIRRVRGRDWFLSAMLGIGFFAVWIAVQWPFANFLISEGARNWVFGSHYLPYFLSPDYPNRYRLLNWDGTTSALLRGLGIATVLAIISSRIGIWFGDWMRRVQR